MRPGFLRDRRRLAWLAAIFLVTTALPAAAIEQWLPGPDLSVGRGYFALVPLPSGDLLAPGGVIPVPGYTNRADIFSLAGQTFSETAAMMNSHRYQFQAVKLVNGKILVAGEQYDGGAKISELFTEATHSWSLTANHPSLDRFAGAMILLPSGKVLFSGGYNGGADGPTYGSAELFDPATSTWSPTGSMVALRAGHSLTLLSTGPNAGQVLVVGGGQRIGLTVESRCELYDPATGTFALTGPLAAARSFHTATRLPDGRVLVTGGHSAGADTANRDSAEIYDPLAGSWSAAAPMAFHRGRHTATLLPNGDVLVVGGAQVGSGTTVNASAEIYHPATNAWRTVPSMAVVRVAQAAALLPSGEVLVAGGFDGASYLRTSEIFRLGLSQPPIAVAGADQTVRPGSAVNLDGGASNDDVTAGANLGFAWSLTTRPAGSAALLKAATTATPSFVADVPGTYVAQLVVTDEDGLASPVDPVTVIGNAAPTAVAQASATIVRIGTPVLLLGTGSTDPENDALSYQWSLIARPVGSAAALANATSVQASLVPDLPGEYRVTLIVSDALGAGTPASLTITGVPVPVTDVPALSGAGGLLLAALLVLAAVVVLRRV
ncbi:MAG: kelch repeat-containing protein [Acidobacteriota bacterium]